MTVIAAHTRLVQSLSDPELNFEINAAVTLNVLRACRATGIPKMIFASTGGSDCWGAGNAGARRNGFTTDLPYRVGKLAGEAYCSAYTGAYGMKTAALRFSNVYGPYS